MNDVAVDHAQTALAMAKCREAGVHWAATSLRQRLHVLHRLRRLLAAQASSVAATLNRPVADTLVAEILPLLEAIKFLEREGPKLLRTRRLRGGRPLWLFGVGAEIRREPVGCVLILAPGNYPLLLPGVQVVQALAAGNCVCLKPAFAGVAAAARFCTLLAQAGLPEGVLQLLPWQAGPAAASAGFDRIVLTGSAETGRRVLSAAAERLIPATVELSGADAVFVLPGADQRLVARCLAYGMRLNGGATCIAPRRVFVPHAMAAPLQELLLPMLAEIPAASLPEPVTARLEAHLQQAAAAGVGVHRAGPGRPVLLSNTGPDLALLRQDVFAPWLALIPVASENAALRADALCPYALGASIFGPAQRARSLAKRVRAGSVCINDLIVPTADPRLPFGGSGQSGFGRTRGAEGLLEMTQTKTISIRKGRFRAHLGAPDAGDARRYAAMILILHGGWRTFWRWRSKC